MTRGIRAVVELAGWKETMRPKTIGIMTVGIDQWIRTVQKDGVKKVRAGG